MKKLGLSVGAFALAFGVMTTGAYAATSTTDTTTTAGSFEIHQPTAISFGTFALTGEKIERTVNLDPVIINDARGNGLGWNVKLSADALTNGTNTLSPGSLALTAAPQISAVEGAITEGVTVGSGSLDNGTGGFVLASAALDKGMGKFTLDFTKAPLKLTILPKEAYTGTYSTTVTWDLLSGPTS